MIGLTKRQSAVLAFIRAYMAEHQIAPSFEEMAAGLGSSSRGHLHNILATIEERGFITRIPGRARSIRLIEPGDLAQFSDDALIAELRRRRIRVTVGGGA